MKKIDITGGESGGVAAFDPKKMRAAGVDDATLCDLLMTNLGHFARLLTDGRGFGITVHDGKATIFGLQDGH